jgi:putative endonuclease
MLKWSLEVQGPNQAILLEKQIKGWGRKKKEALIENRLEILPFISKNLRERNKQDQ